MKIKIFLTIAALLMVSTAHAGWQDDTNVYFGAELGFQKTDLDSGGYNTAGMFKNTNDDDDSGAMIGIKVGLDYSNTWRLDLAFRQYHKQEFTTNSCCPGGVGGSPYFYESEVKTQVLMTSVYYDFLTIKKLALYGGAGIGIAHTKLSTTDGVVDGSGSETNMAWQVELGAEYPVTDSFMLSLGLRYVDLGETEIDLNGGAFGDFSANLTSQEAFLGLRFIF